MDFTIRLRAEGTSETRAQADAVKAVRTEIDRTQKKAAEAKLLPRKVREAKEDRELDRYADKLQKSLIKEDKDRQKAEAKTAADAQKSAARSAAEKAKQQASAEKESAKRDASEAASVARATALAARKQASDEKAAKRAEDTQKKAADRLVQQKRKDAEKEDKEVARFADKAQKELIKAAKKDEKLAEQRAAEKIDPEMRSLSKVEQAKKNAAKKSDEELAARIDPSLKRLSETEKAKNKLYGRIGTGVVLAGAAAGAAIIGVASKLAPLALGYAGMARISTISAQAGFNMRRLFTGTNPKPLLDALQRTSQLIDPRTFTGKALGDMLVRSSNSFFNMLAKAEPYARLFFKGMLLGALQVEGAWLKLQIAIQPAIALFPKGTGLMTAFSAGALAVKSAFALMGVGIVVGAVKAGAAMVSFGASALAATGPLIPFTVAIVAWTSAIKGAIDIAKEWDENSLGNIGEGIKNTLGITTDAERDKNFKGVAQAVSGDDYDKKYKLGKYADKTVAPTPKNAEKQAATAGPPIGRNLGLGMLAGMKDMQGKVEAGGRDLVLAAEGGAKAEAVIRSPSDKWRRQIGRQLGAGAALGLMDSADKMDEAGRAAMPDTPGVGGFAGGKRGGVVIQQIGPFFGVGADVESLIRRIVPDVIDDMAERIGALAN
jgi:hypothetical protein